MKHHYIPQFYLEGFTDRNNNIWVYEKGNPSIRKSRPENEAYQKHYYSFTTPDGKKDSETFEDALSEIEGQAAPIFQKLKEFKPFDEFDEKERGIFAGFLALTLVRVPNFRQKLERPRVETVKIIMDLLASDTALLKSAIKRLERDRGNKIDVPVEELQEFARAGKYDIKVNPEFILERIGKYTIKFAPIFYEMKWKFFIATDDYKFVTSDNPLHYCDLTQDRRVGLLNKNVEVTFPVSKDLAFFGSWQNIKEGYEKADNNLVKEVNLRTVISALRFVYSSKKSDKVNRFVQKYKDTAPRIKVG